MGNQNHKAEIPIEQNHYMFIRDVAYNVFRFCKLGDTLALIMVCKKLCNLFEDDIFWKEWINKHPGKIHVDIWFSSIKQGLKYNETVTVFNNSIKNNKIRNYEMVICLFNKLISKDIRKTNEYDTDDIGVILNNDLAFKTCFGDLHLPKTLRIAFEYPAEITEKTLTFPFKESSPYFVGEMNNRIVSDHLYWTSITMYENGTTVIRLERVFTNITFTEINSSTDRFVSSIYKLET